MPSADEAPVRGPHQSIDLGSPRERFLAELFDRLWQRYRSQILATLLQYHLSIYEVILMNPIEPSMNFRFMTRVQPGITPGAVGGVDY